MLAVGRQLALAFDPGSGAGRDGAGRGGSRATSAIESASKPASSPPSKSRGGPRTGAGRPPKGERPGVSHQRRPALSRHHPIHVTQRIRGGLPSLRTHRLFSTTRKALSAGKERFGFALIHFSVQSNHLHLIAEVESRAALTRGMQGLSVRLARALNRELGRHGPLFSDRYHARPLKTPRTVRLALRYVLLNARKHQRAAVPTGFIDPCSSAPWFPHFPRPHELAFGSSQALRDWQRASHSSTPPVATPRTWLLTIGFLRAGPFDIDEVPAS